MIFTNKQLKSMIVPLLLEQLLVVLVGLMDTFVISYAGEDAVSGVSLINSFNTILIYLFTALASGGAVVVSQYIGSRRTEKASESISQLLMSSTVFSCVLMVLILLFHINIIDLLFGRVEAGVREACITYLKISAYSYPALAVYNTGAALYRSLGKTKTTMIVSGISNVMNVIGNLIGVFVLHAGVAGVAYPTLIARTFTAVVMTILCFKDHDGVRYVKQWILSWNSTLQKQILSIAVPNGVESGIFQLVKVALSSVVALFGTYQIAANGIAQSFWSLAALVGSAMGPVMITVIGQCMGAGEVEQAEYYFKKLMKITVLISVIWNGSLLLVSPVILRFYSISDQTRTLVMQLIVIHNIANSLAFPFADPLSKGLRAAGDATFTMGVSLFTTIGVRLVFSLLFAIVMNLGVIGIALAMCLDWTVRGIILWARFKQGKWKNMHVIETAAA